MITKPIDVWDVETFDDALLTRLNERSELIMGYLETDRRQLFEREASDHRHPYPTNPYARHFIAFEESLIPVMAERSIRAWHYTRLTEAEAQTMRRTGPVLSDIQGIRNRLEAQVIAGSFTSEIAEALWDNSPFHEQEEIRTGMFWMSSSPTAISNGLVDGLLKHWGGESVYFYQEDEELLAILQKIGVARVIELKVPLCATNREFTAAGAVISTFARSIGCDSRNGSFDLYANRRLGPEAVLAIHSEGDAAFEAMGREYPERFVDCHNE